MVAPTIFGQKFTFSENLNDDILWLAKDINGTFLEKKFSIESISNPDNIRAEDALLKTLANAYQLSNNKKKLQGFNVESTLNYDRNFGLGSSASFLRLVADIFDCNPFSLRMNGWNGSGFDIAATTQNQLFTYSIEGDLPKVETAIFNNKLTENIFFIYTNKKQNTRDSIQRIKLNDTEKADFVAKANALTVDFQSCSSNFELIMLMEEHEELVSFYTGYNKIKVQFTDFQGGIKSLGAWGGDFIMATGEKEYIYSYFKTKGLDKIYSWNEIIKHN